ncbi:Odorant receptor 66 [Blattella germanica]|nr:Odorant receptor 66 [Blattella germanica]
MESFLLIMKNKLQAIDLNQSKNDLSINVNTNIQYLKMLAIWPLKEDIQIWKRAIMYVVFVIGVFVQFIIICSQILDIVVGVDEHGELTDNIFMTGIAFNGLFKQVYVAYRKKSFQSLVKSIDKVFYKAQEPFKNEKKIILENSLFYGKLVTWSIICVCIFSGFCYPLIPLSAGFHSLVDSNSTAPRPLPHSGWFPFDKNESPYYEIVYAIMSFNAFYIALYASSTDTLIISLMIHTFKQFEILQFSIRNVKQYAINRINAPNNQFGQNERHLSITSDTTVYSYNSNNISLIKKTNKNGFQKLNNENYMTDKESREKFNEELNICLGLCIKKHQELLSFSEHLNDLASPFLLVQLVVDVSFLCILTLHMTVVPVMSFKFISAFGIVMAVLNIVGLISWCSGELSVKSEGIRDAAFECEWETTSSHFKNSLKFLMLRAMKPCTIKAGKFMDFNLANYAMVLKASYSYFTVLQRVYHDK